MVLYVRTKGDPRQLLIPIQRAAQAAGPGVIASDVRTGRTVVDNGLFQAKVGVAMLSLFGLLALALASVGLYGLMAYSVSQRVREIGVRMALGAPQRAVIRMVLKQAMILVLAGILIGFLGSLAAARLLTKILYGVGANDPLSLAGSVGLLLIVSLAACYLPARRASHVDPLTALRES
jgi:putative ABC transport system permease protein